MRSSEQTSELVAALVKAQAAIKPPVKDRHVQAGSRRYSYADLATVIESVREPLGKSGLAVTQATDLDGDTLRLVTRLAHISGQFLEAVYPLPRGASPQELGSALTYARRYSICAILGIAAEDDDDGEAATGGHAVRALPRPAPAPAPKGIKVTGVEESGKAGVWRIMTDSGPFAATSPEHADVARSCLGKLVAIKHHANAKGTSIIDSIEPVEVQG